MWPKWHHTHAITHSHIFIESLNLRAFPFDVVVVSSERSLVRSFVRRHMRTETNWNKYIIITVSSFRQFRCIWIMNLWLLHFSGIFRRLTSWVRSTLAWETTILGRDAQFVNVSILCMRSAHYAHSAIEASYVSRSLRTYLADGGLVEAAGRGVVCGINGCWFFVRGLEFRGFDQTSVAADEAN